LYPFSLRVLAEYGEQQVDFEGSFGGDIARAVNYEQSHDLQAAELVGLCEVVYNAVEGFFRFGLGFQLEPAVDFDGVLVEGGTEEGHGLQPIYGFLLILRRGVDRAEELDRVKELLEFGEEKIAFLLDEVKLELFVVDEFLGVRLKVPWACLVSS
jgi:hypothetical protein